MNAAELSGQSVERSPVFVDASGRRRRGVRILGYLGASACTAYLAAFGITVGTQARVLDAAGAALEPTPSVEDEGADDAGGDFTDTVVPSAGAGSHAVVDVANTSAATHKSVRGSDDASRTSQVRGRHAATPIAGASPRVALRVVRSPQLTVGAVTAPASSPRPTTPTTGGTTGGGPSSGGAGPTTGTGTTGGTGTGDDRRGHEHGRYVHRGHKHRGHEHRRHTTGGTTTGGGTTTPATTGTTTPSSGSDAATADVLTTGSGTNQTAG